MPIINSQVKPFKADAFKNGDFVKVSDADLKGKWSVVFFYPADFTFVCPTELEDLADSRRPGRQDLALAPTHRGATRRRPRCRGAVGGVLAQAARPGSDGRVG